MVILLIIFHPTKDEYLEFEFKPWEYDKRDKIWNEVK